MTGPPARGRLRGSGGVPPLAPFEEKEMKDTPTVADQVTTVTWNRHAKTVTVVGLYGTRVVREDNPVEIGLVVLEMMTGEKLAPPDAYREPEEVDLLDPNLRSD